MNREEMERSIADAGWELDGGFADRLLVGNAGGLAVLAHEWAWQDGNGPAYELYDVERHLSCWVREVPTPQRAAELLEERGRPPEEQPGNPYERGG